MVFVFITHRRVNEIQLHYNCFNIFIFEWLIKYSTIKHFFSDFSFIQFHKYVIKIDLMSFIQLSVLTQSVEPN